MKTIIAFTAGTLLLAGSACAHDHHDHSVPASLDVAGAEPFWSVQIRPDGIVLSTPDQLETKFPAVAGVTGKDGATTWTTTAADKSSLTVTVRAGACSDGMSERDYPMSASMRTTASVEVRDYDAQGCAAPPGYFKDTP